MDSLLSQNWPPNTLVVMGAREAARKPIQRHGLKSTETDCQKNGWNATEFLFSVDLGKVWPPLVLDGYLDIFILVFLEDILVYSRTVEAQAEHLWKVLAALRKHRLFTKSSKCNIIVKEAEFLS